jgi:cellulose synthase/poly-beta-1,6-N-acetylglucosamine synthase-like glycosyltransferase
VLLRPSGRARTRYRHNGPSLTLTLSRIFTRQFRLYVNLFASWRQKKNVIKPPEIREFSPEHVTAIIPTLGDDLEALRETVTSILRNRPYRVLIVTVEGKVDVVSELANHINQDFSLLKSNGIKVYSSQLRNKRYQMCRGLRKIKTPFVLFADDDVTLTDQTLDYMLAPFEGNARMGGVGTAQRVKRGDDWNLWRFFGAQYIERRNFDCSAGVYMDGGLPCLSGRCVLYRSSIIKSDAFMHAFTHETWANPLSWVKKVTYLIHADDDNFLTRSLVNGGWDITIQMHEDCTVETTLEDGWKYGMQCLRWSRSNWRSNYTSLMKDRTIWR